MDVTLTTRINHCLVAKAWCKPIDKMVEISKVTWFPTDTQPSEKLTTS